MVAEPSTFTQVVKDPNCVPTSIPSFLSSWVIGSNKRPLVQEATNSHWCKKLTDVAGNSTSSCKPVARELQFVRWFGNSGDSNSMENVIFANGFEDHIGGLKVCPPRSTSSDDTNPDFIVWRSFILVSFFSKIRPQRKSYSKVSLNKDYTDSYKN
ncbi:hypothetical protein AAG906_013117 [Vitis piasezkii]